MHAINTVVSTRSDPSFSRVVAAAILPASPSRHAAAGHRRPPPPAAYLLAAPIWLAVPPRRRAPARSQPVRPCRWPPLSSSLAAVAARARRLRHHRTSSPNRVRGLRFAREPPTAPISCRRVAGEVVRSRIRAGSHHRRPSTSSPEPSSCRAAVQILIRAVARANYRNICELETYSKAWIRVMGLSSKLTEAFTFGDVFEIKKSFEFELTLDMKTSIIFGFFKNKNGKPVFGVFEETQIREENESDGCVGPNLFIYNSLLGAIKQCEKYEQVERVMDDMREEGVVPNVVTYNTLMSIYVEQGRPKEALDVFEIMREKGLPLSPVSYSTALLAYRRMEDGDGALRFYKELKEKYDKGEIGRDAKDENWESELVNMEKFITRICYQVMRRWLIKGENLNAKVLKLLTDMDEAGVKPGRAEYERLSWACTREDHYVVAKELYKRIRERESEISLSVCNHVIWLMGKAKKWWAALEIYEDLLDKGPKPNNLSYELMVSHFNILLTAARRRGTWRWGVRLLNKMEEKGIKPGTRQWNAVLVACSKASETSAAVQIFKRMVEQGEKPTILSYGALLSALEKGKLFDEALQVWKHMIKVGVEPNLYAYTILASVYAGQGKSDMVESVIQEMESSGIEPSIVTYNAIISGCFRNGKGSTAFEWFERMKLQNILPNEITYEALIMALAKDSKPRLAYEMYSRARDGGLHLSFKAYDAVVESSRHYGVAVDVRSLGPRPSEKKRKKKINVRKNLSEFSKLADVPRKSKPFEREELYAQQIQEGQ
ncbi:hypothetical protein Syun_020355 [Stephania yunnanensis]|uniref:PROP1-like PPR domain-containing protein n=1 Tax=Stephania yunnanensis TaxID=152371 RepID=A0AAP0NNT4_9MAGN